MVIRVDGQERHYVCSLASESGYFPAAVFVLRRFFIVAVTVADRKI